MNKGGAFINFLAFLLVVGVIGNIAEDHYTKPEATKEKKVEKTDAEKEANFIKALIDSPLEQRKGAYAKLAHSICFIHDKKGSALLYEQCMNKHYNEYKVRYEAEVRMAKR